MATVSWDCGRLLLGEMPTQEHESTAKINMKLAKILRSH
jgi:hypothetical protein